MSIGLTVRESVLYVADGLKNPAAPGWVTLVLLSLLAIAFILFLIRTLVQASAVAWLGDQIRRYPDATSFAAGIIDIDREAGKVRTPSMRGHIAETWKEYRDTLIEQTADGQTVLRNSARPSMFFNLDDLGFGAGFARYIPGLFVTAGLFLTFLGLISALKSMDLSGGNSTAALNDLLKIASAKFIMSLTGLLCSIVFTILLRVRMGRLERRLHQLCHDLERRLSFVSLESLAIDQLKAAQEQREHLRALAFEMVAELGRPLREELPAAISNSITTAMSPLLDQVSRMGTDGMGSMVENLSRQFSGDVSRALTDASGRLAEAGGRIGQLADRMDQSSGRMGAEMEQAVSRVAQSIDDLRSAMGATATSTSTALTQGAEQLLNVMNQTLAGIRDNTGEGARAMSAAASEMREAATGFRTELETASRSGAEAARHSLEAAATDASRTVSDSFGRTSAEIAGMATALAERASQDLIAPIDAIAARIQQVVTELGAGVVEMRRMSDAVRSGAEAGETAAGTFRAASQTLAGAAQPVRETSERIAASLQTLTESTQSVAGTVSRSAERVATTAAATLENAGAVLGAERLAIDTALARLLDVIKAQKGQGDRLDEMDLKLGKAFEIYRTEVEAAVGGMNGHVKTMSTNMNSALDKMRGIIDSVTEFQPQSRRA